MTDNTTKKITIGVEAIDSEWKKRAIEEAALLNPFKKENYSKFNEAFSQTISGDNGFGKVATIFSDFNNSLYENLAKVLSDALNELDTLLSSSRLSNATTRELSFKYGFSSAEVYGYQKAMDLTGISSQEDLLYATEEERKRFYSAMTEYAEKYNSLDMQNFLDEYQDFTYEMTKFKEDMTLEVVQFLMDNKDTIKSFFEIAITIGEGLIGVIDNILNGNIFTNPLSLGTSDIVNINITNSASVTNSSETIEAQQEANTNSTNSQIKSIIDTLLYK